MLLFLIRSFFFNDISLILQSVSNIPDLSTVAYIFLEMKIYREPNALVHSRVGIEAAQDLHKALGSPRGIDVNESENMHSTNPVPSNSEQICRSGLRNIF